MILVKWKCFLLSLDVGLVQDLSTKSHSVTEPELVQSSVHPTAEQTVGKSYSDEAIKTERFLNSHMKKILFPVPPVKTSAAIVSTGAESLLPISVQVEKEINTKDCKALIRFVWFYFSVGNYEERLCILIWSQDLNLVFLSSIISFAIAPLDLMLILTSVLPSQMKNEGNEICLRATSKLFVKPFGIFLTKCCFIKSRPCSAEILILIKVS